MQCIPTLQYAFNGVALYEQASDLILGSQFDCYLPRKSRKAFEHQKIVSNTIMNVENLKNFIDQSRKEKRESDLPETTTDLVSRQRPHSCLRRIPDWHCFAQTSIGDVRCTTFEQVFRCHRVTRCQTQ